MTDFKLPFIGGPMDGHIESLKEMPDNGTQIVKKRITAWWPMPDIRLHVYAVFNERAVYLGESPEEDMP